MQSVGALVNRIPTRYHLTHPDPQNTAEGLQAALFRAARLLVPEDVESLTAACLWFRASGFRDACPGLDR